MQPTGSGITLVLPEQQAEISRVAARLGHGDRFAESGMHVALPLKVYSSSQLRF